MHRYVVRFAVALLTFAIGVAISISLGLFRPNFQNRAFAYRERRGCGRRFVPPPPPQLADVPSGVPVADVPSGMSVQNLPNQPLKILILSTSDNSPKRVVRLLVQNTSNQRVEAFAVSWEAMSGGVLQQRTVVNSNATLQPGGTDLVTLDCDAADFVFIRLDSAMFADNSLWHHGQKVVRVE